jgi:hypothetical protein
VIRHFLIRRIAPVLAAGRLRSRALKKMIRTADSHS